MAKMGGRVGRWARRAAGCASIVALAWLSAGLVLRAVEPATDNRAGHRTVGADRFIRESAEDPRSRQSFSPIFGAAAVTDPAKVTPVVRGTTYSLRGLFNPPGGRGLAMIESSGVTALYREGDRLPGGETVTGVDPESVTLSGARGLTLIAFEPSEPLRAEPRREAGAGRPKTEVPDAAYAAPSEVEKEWRLPVSRTMLEEQISSTAVLSSARFKRVRARNGKMGLRVKWLREDDLLDAFGLRPGDVILAVNGLPANHPRTMETLFKALPESREVVIDLERRKGPHRLVIPMSHG